MAFEGRGGMWVSSRQFGAIVEALAGGFERVAMRLRMWAVFCVPIFGGIFLRARACGLPPYSFFNTPLILIISFGGLKGSMWEG